MNLYRPAGSEDGFQSALKAMTTPFVLGIFHIDYLQKRRTINGYYAPLLDPWAKKQRTSTFGQEENNLQIQCPGANLCNIYEENYEPKLEMFFNPQYFPDFTFPFDIFFLLTNKRLAGKIYTSNAKITTETKHQFCGPSEKIIPWFLENLSERRAKCTELKGY